VDQDDYFDFRTRAIRKFMQKVVNVFTEVVTDFSVSRIGYTVPAEV
jgi:hypothetical protein